MTDAKTQLSATAPPNVNVDGHGISGTALWMVAARLGPIGTSLVAALTLNSPEYSHYVVALAWIGGLTSVLATSAQAVAVRVGHGAAQPGHGAADALLRHAILIACVIPVILAGVFGALGYAPTLVVAVALCGFIGALNACFGALLWARRAVWVLGLLGLLESGLMVVGVGLGGRLLGDATAALSGMGLASLVAGLAYVRALGGHAHVLAMWRNGQPRPHVWRSILGPSLVNGLTNALAPAIALVIAAARAPESAALYGIMMLAVAALLFPVQVLAIAFAQPLVVRTFDARARLGGLGLGVGMFWGLAVFLALMFLGPQLGTMEIAATRFDILAHITRFALLTGVILLCFCPVAMAGPIVQADGRYWTWAALGVMSGAIFVGAAALLPAGSGLSLQACLASAGFRLLVGVPLAWRIVVRWQRLI
ncbi:MAG: hypothetical protein RLZZ157_222 [Pseudomonadota bacterium]